ncbi:LacI family DNA-binding transcriptional regulator [Rhodoferax sp. GW822-FHT02A01]|uniref:LacI family DNA-binding transcriptional regulator n=1 Tax=Rhodoferax sp. GW822-FHT02A01 TaxID=3141537 RepID=UPI00315CA76E
MNLDNNPPKRARRRSGAVTLQDVAQLAGVAPITVSRALNTPAQVSSDLLRKVQDAVQRTGYVPNRMAGGLASQRSRLIAAVVPSTVMSVFMETIEALNTALMDAGYQLMLGQSNYAPERETRLLEEVIARRPDGIFLIGLLPSGASRTRLLASGIPVVETWDLGTSPMDMLVGFSHADIGRAAADFLIGKGRTRLTMVMADDARAQRRFEAFAATVAQAGLPTVQVINVGSARDVHTGRQALTQLLAQAPDVDAVFCSSDLLALGVLTEARVRSVAVPERLAILGFGDVPLVADLVPALSTVRINGAEIGRLSAEMLIARAEGRNVDQPVVDVGFSIVERDST